VVDLPTSHSSLVSAASGARGVDVFRAIDPTTERVVREIPCWDPQRVEAALAAASAAARAWRAVGVEARGAALRGLAKSLRRDADVLAALAAEEMGKPLAQGRSEIEKCAWTLEVVAASASADLEPVPVQGPAPVSRVVLAPLGVILAVMPWNFPFWQVVRFAASAIAVGNVVLLKHAPNVPGCAEALVSLFREASPELPLVVPVVVGTDWVPALLADDRVAAVTFTGSTSAGRSIASVAGRHLKKSVLELGGSDPYVVLADADVAHAAKVCADARMVNAGQSCVAAKRFIVVEAQRAAFLQHLVEHLRAHVVGDPRDPSTTVGPLARSDLRVALHRQVMSSLRDGARIIEGGELPDRIGYFYPPTVLTDVRPGMAVWDDETFGPVAAIASVPDDATALAWANRTVFGLGAAVFTRDRERGVQLASDVLEAGNCTVNGPVRSDPRLPFGGVRASGWGRELGSYGLREFVNVKTVLAW
jgi:succinate-semialdehyde dehydrogenase/glutarate-semialdehyde dehydrogenase